MAWISAHTIIVSLSLFHITLGYFFLTSPGTIADQALVHVLGEAMGMPATRSFDAHSPALALLGIFLAMMGVTDIVSLTMHHDVTLAQYWSTQAPVRVFMSMAALFYCFFFSPSSPFRDGPPRFGRPYSADYSRLLAGGPSLSAGDQLKNRVFFTFMFFEAMTYLWLWVTLAEALKKIRERRPRARVYPARRNSRVSKSSSSE